MFLISENSVIDFIGQCLGIQEVLNKFLSYEWRYTVQSAEGEDEKGDI